MTRIAASAVLLVASVAWLSAHQTEGPAPKDPNFFIGKWELAVGQHSINGRFDRILELKVDDTKLTGTMTTSTRTVEVVGEISPSFYFRSETETFSGAAWDGTLLMGCHFQGNRLTGWAAKRLAGQ